MKENNSNKRFIRQITLKEIGIDGQHKIRESRVVILGVGGLGTFSSLLLAEMGIGFMRLVDRDIIQVTNLHRTPLYSRKDINKAKVEIAAERLKEVNPEGIFEALPVNITETNIDILIKDVDVVIDGLDSFEARKIVNNACIKYDKPFIFAGVLGNTGNVSVFNNTSESPCLSCLYHSIDDENLPTCDTVGIHPALLAVITGIQVHEAIKVLLGLEVPLDGKLLFIDLINQSFDQIPIKKSPKCKICSLNEVKDSKREIVDEFKLYELCGSESYVYSPNKSLKLNLIKIEKDLEKKYKIITKGKMSITFLDSRNDIKISILSSGNVILSGSKEKEIIETIIEKLKKILF